MRKMEDMAPADKNGSSHIVSEKEKAARRISGDMPKHKCEIREIIDETYDVRTFILERPENFVFEAGQDVMVGLPDGRKINGKTMVPMTMSNPPTDDDKILLTIRNVGGFTSSIYALGVGESVLVSDPRGRTFAVDEDFSDDIVMLAAGTGITPFMSIIRLFLATDKPNRLKLFYSNRAEEDIIFRKELDHINSEQDNVDVVYTLTRDKPRGWQGYTGRFKKDDIKQHISEEDTRQSVWMICGPPNFVNDMRVIADDLGVSDERIRYEEWEIPGRENVAAENKSLKNEKYDSSDSGEDAVLASPERQINLKPGPIKVAAEELGVPFGCKQGICGTCEVEVLEGQDNLEAKNNKEENMRLPKDHRLCCQARIKGGRVVIDW